MKALFIFIDGLGIAPAAPDNPVSPAICPFLHQLIAAHSSPIDACLGVPGLPQSATGQASLFTGVNAAQVMGRHVEGFPGPTLRKLVENDNIFLTLQRAQRRARFADAYLADSVDEIRARRFRSVTTIAALSCPDTIALRQDLLANQGVCHDLTREILLPKGFLGPVITPQMAAEHLAQIALGYDLTLFECFRTDLAGHTCNLDEARAVLTSLDGFLSTLFPMAVEMGILVLLTSDHGNIESAKSHGHTFNPVPFIAQGPGADQLRASVSSLVDVTPQLLRVLTAGP
ncbi:MAG: peptidase [Kiritimatiellae bacterium]|nr:peptidase [Kiritimatiellia bacterium]